MSRDGITLEIIQLSSFNRLLYETDLNISWSDMDVVGSISGGVEELVSIAKRKDRIRVWTNL